MTRKLSVQEVECIDSFIDGCLIPTTSRKEVMQSSKIYTYYLQFAEYYKLPQVHLQTLAKSLKKRFHSRRDSNGNFYYCKIKEELIQK